MTPMRRSDREITDRNEILQVMERCDVCRLALNDGEYPYILPLNFGMEQAGEQIILYFHGATEGKKLDLIARDPRASFEMDCGHILHYDKERGYCTMGYQSVIGHGRLELVPDAEKARALGLLMAHYHGGAAPFSPAAIPRTTVLRLRVEEISGKTKDIPKPLVSL